MDERSLNRCIQQKYFMTRTRAYPLTDSKATTCSFEAEIMSQRDSSIEFPANTQIVPTIQHVPFSMRQKWSGRQKFIVCKPDEGGDASCVLHTICIVRRVARMRHINKGAPEGILDLGLAHLEDSVFSLFPRAFKSQPQTSRV